MPPFSKLPPKKPTPASTGFVVTFPKCEWCNAIGAHRCKGCDRFTCYNCLASFEEGGKCEHFPYQPVTTTGWGIDCPSPKCDSECNLCLGRGVIFSKALLLLYAPKEVRET